MKLILGTGEALTPEEILAKADKIPGGLAAGKKDSAFPRAKLAEGAEVESEHTSDAAIAREIAKDHLEEDSSYYKKLKTIEKGDLAPEKARKILHDKEVHGNPLTDKQRQDRKSVV